MQPCKDSLTLTKQEQGTKHNRSNYLCLNLPFDDVTHKGGGPFRANPVGEEAADKKEQRHPESHDHPVYSTVLHVGQAHGEKYYMTEYDENHGKAPEGVKVSQPSCFLLYTFIHVDRNGIWPASGKRSPDEGFSGDQNVIPHYALPPIYIRQDVKRTESRAQIPAMREPWASCR